ncbi:hypothetical protein WJ78_14320 [Burkholderia ubonensis]|uniref:AAA family ATPase n=1 Tax=Burkholderia ubonensis TaxID=101571 RepID=UPI0005D79A47|nr:DUF3696 domain-containing protein [Burkholderia ubonensis]AJX14552.1 AAA domain protein [Burkholderia ubonensis MSMB22]KVO67405.1 hypothetical protein WJ78_14320 [Burkholderia ubonensis]KVP95721.1 hypothetical protein WJ97_15410 [Burkholderia ubonensis]
MIRRLEITGFKRFEAAALSMAPLTVLAGLNGSGKTSIVHALLLMREAVQSSANGAVLLNGPFGLNLGTAEDVVNWAGTGTIEFRAEDETGAHTWILSSPADEAMYLTADALPSPLPEAFKSNPGAFIYLSAERFGPRTSVAASSLPTDQIEVGFQGENSAQLLEARGGKPANDDRRHPESSSPFLFKYEVERWLSEIARPVEIDSLHHSGADAYALRFRSPGGEWVRATNMGFGVSYALPIVLAGLTATVGGLVLVENPEAHLHPAGQSRMGTFLAWVASKGVQVVVETHSDHILNGMRRAVGEYKLLDPTAAVVHFFEADELANISELRFTDTGGMSHWPAGFFDQYQIDIAALGRVRRNGGMNGIRR